MLPYLKRNQEASASGPIESIERKPDEGADIDSMQIAAEDLIAAVHSKNANAVAAAIKAAFEILDSQPHEEGPHI